MRLFFKTASQDFLADKAPLRRLIEQVLALDPRPAFHGDPQRVYAVGLDDVEVRWRVEAGEARVVSVRPV